MPYRLTTIVTKRVQRNYKLVVAVAGAVVAVLICLVTYLSMAPARFPQKQIISIKKGTYMSQAADILKEDDIIKSPILFKFLVVILSGHRQVQAGDYLFDTPQSVFKVAYRAAYGLEGLPKIKVTLFEGMTSADMAFALKKNIPLFDVQTFLALAKPLEGSLFPDTYYFYENSKPQEVVNQLHSTFNEKTKPLLLQIQSFGKSAETIITMASLVEEEASNSTDRRIIAGILWRRLAHNMPLQVDAPFYYIIGKGSSQLTLKDLSMDSPYNLYKHTGLPPRPIDNPGLDAIVDTITPTTTDYLYFLSGRDGKMHYASTFEGHVANKGKYLE